MFRKNGDVGAVSMNDSISRKTMAHGEKTLLVEISLAKGADLPAHTHRHEQTGYLISGQLKFYVNGEEIVVKPGDGWCFEGGLEHAAHADEDSVVIEVFSPVREEFLP